MPRRAELPNLQPARLDIPHYRGDTLSVKLRFQSQGLPVDVSTWDLEAYIRTDTESEKIGEFSVLRYPADGADETNGIIRLVLPHQVAQQLPATCIWDLQASEQEFVEVDFDQDPLTPPTLVPVTVRVRTVLRGHIYSPADVTYDTAGAGILPIARRGARR